MKKHYLRPVTELFTALTEFIMVVNSQSPDADSKINIGFDEEEEWEIDYNLWGDTAEDE